MLKRMSIKKIMVSSSAIILLMVICLIPSNKRDIELKNDKIEYTYNNIESTIYLIDSNGYVARSSIATCKCDGVDLAKDLVNGLIIGGSKNNIIPNGFRSVIPPDVSILNIELKDKVITIDFSSQFLEVNEKDEEKMIEAIIYTLTSIDGIDKVIIKVEGNVIDKMPNSKNYIPSVLDRSYGINKVYDLSGLNDIVSYTTFYTSSYNDNIYYVPVTKYVNSKDSDIVKVIIKELGSSPIYQTNLMSYLNTNATLNSYDFSNNILSLNFNELLLNELDKKNILEEVIYTISLSMNNIYDDLKSVSFLVNNEEVYKVNISDIK